MFTGIVEEIGTVERMPPSDRAGAFTIAASLVLEDAHVGDSIAVNGVCLTATSFTPRNFTADVMPETLRRSGLGRLRPGEGVNLERAMPANGRFGGHIVSGHIDGVGRIASVTAEQNARILRIECDSSLCDLIVEKGSIAVDGTSLTVAGVEPRAFSVSIIPHTAEATCLLRKPAGSIVNLENDIVGKYVQKFLKDGPIQGRSGGSFASGAPPAPSASPQPAPPLTLEYLQANGF